MPVIVSSYYSSIPGIIWAAPMMEYFSEAYAEQIVREQWNQVLERESEEIVRPWAIDLSRTNWELVRPWWAVRIN